MCAQRQGHFPISDNYTSPFEGRCAAAGLPNFLRWRDLESASVDVVIYLAPAYRHPEAQRLAYTAYSRARHRAHRPQEGHCATRKGNGGGRTPADRINRCHATHTQSGSRAAQRAYGGPHCGQTVETEIGPLRRHSGVSISGGETMSRRMTPAIDTGGLVGPSRLREALLLVREAGLQGITRESLRTGMGDVSLRTVDRPITTDQARRSTRKQSGPPQLPR